MTVTVSEGSAITGLEVFSGGSGESKQKLTVGVLVARGQEFKANPLRASVLHVICPPYPIRLSRSFFWSERASFNRVKTTIHLIKESSKRNIPCWDTESSWGGQKGLEMLSD